MKKNLLMFALSLLPLLFVTPAHAKLNRAFINEILNSNSEPAKFPNVYVWEKPAGPNRIQRGVSTTSKLSEMSSQSLNPILTCHAGETLVNGGCSAVYGVRLQGTMPLAQSGDPGVDKWICNFDQDAPSALTLDGNRQPANTVLPADQLTATTYIVVTCEKNALQSQ